MMMENVEETKSRLRGGTQVEETTAERAGGRNEYEQVYAEEKAAEKDE